MKYILIIFWTWLLVIPEVSLFAQSKTEMLYEKIPDWFQEAKFGVFVHFAENGHFRYYTDSAKTQGQEHNPEAYIEGGKSFTLKVEDVYEWVKKFENWGAKYAVLTAKHRPGFCLWDTKVHSRNSVKMSPAKLDIVAVWTQALRKENIKVGLYYSHYDWGDADFIQAKGKNEHLSEGVKKTAWQSYLQKRDQTVKELVSNYGKIDLIWWDEDWCAKDYHELGSDNLLDIVFENQPEVVINNRCRHPSRWHYGTPEKYVPLRRSNTIPWETCDNLIQGNGWGYREPNGYPLTAYKTKEDILLTFLEVIGRGGNYLLNIGPKPDGTIPKVEEQIMDYLGDFIRQNSEAIYATQAGLSRDAYGNPSTRKGTTVYLFDTHPAIDGEITLKGIQNKLLKATHLSTQEELEFRYTGGRPKHGRPAWLRIKTVSQEKPYPHVYKLEFEGESLQVKF